METFQLSELAHRLLPMVDLIGEDDQPIELASLLAMAQPVGTSSAASTWDSNQPIHIPSAHRETLPAYDPISRIEPSEPDPEIFDTFDNQSEANSLDTGRTVSLDQTIVMERADDLELIESDQLSESRDTVDVLPSSQETSEEVDADVEDISLTSEPLDFQPTEFESTEFEPTGFESDQFEPTDLDVQEYRDSDDDIDPYPAVVDQVERVPVTGPVAPRPLSTALPQDFGHGPNVPKLRKKKQASGLRTIIGTVLGGALAVPLAALFLSWMGKPLDLGFWPFDGNSLTRTIAALPMDIPSDRPGRSRDPGRSLAEDLKPSADDTATEPPPSAITLPTEQSTSEPGNDAVATAAIPSTSATETPATIELPPSVFPAEAKPDAKVTITESVPPTLTMPSEPAPIKPVVEVAKPAEPSFDEMVENGTNAGIKPAAEPKPAPSISFDPPGSPKLVEAIKDVDTALRGYVEFPNPNDAQGLKAPTAKLYAALANVALFPQSVSQNETASLVDRIGSSGAIKNMIKAAPVWLRTDKRTNQGFFAGGKVVRENDEWVLKWNGDTNLLLQNVNGLKFNDGDDVLLLGKIIDPTPPSIIRVVFMQKQPAQ